MIPFKFSFKDKLSSERSVVGLDIGVSSVKAVKLKLVKDKAELCAFEMEPVNESQNLEAALKKIAQAIERHKVNISVSGPQVVLRYANFPQMKPEELKQALKFEAHKYIPFGLNEVNLDSYILKQNTSDNKMFVLLAAAKKDLISQRLKLLEDVGLKAHVLDIDSVAIMNAFQFNYPKSGEALQKKAIALLNIGATLSNLNILEDNLPRLSRDIQVAGNFFTQKIADTLGVDFKVAEEAKLEPTKNDLEKISKAIEAAMASLSNEIITSFDFYESQSSFTIGKIYLCGGGSLFTGIKDTLANLLGFEVEYWDPLKELNLSTSLDLAKLKAVSSQLAVAVGLGLRA